jgi:hypothetical protein
MTAKPPAAENNIFLDETILETSFLKKPEKPEKPEKTDKTASALSA